MNNLAAPDDRSLRDVRRLSDRLFELLPGDSLFARPVPDRHRLVFYLGHLEAFDWNLTKEAFNVTTGQDGLDRLFAFGIDPEPGQAPSDVPGDWPTEPVVREYVSRTRRAIDEAWDRLPAQLRHVALEHRLMHIETLAYLLHELPYQAKVPGTVPKARDAAEVSNSMLRVEAGLATLGQRRGEAFGWDNEFDEHQVEVDAFRVSRFKVTNREYLQYVEAGGCPSHFWVKREGQWFWRGMFGEYPLPLDGPAWVTHEQATGYAAWAGKQLPTEAQFHRYAYGAPGGKERQYPWGDQAPALGLGNFDFTFWDPIAVNATPAGDSAFGVSQAVGNGWEWTSTPFAPFEGFERFPFYPGYSADFFDGQHYVLKGGSPRTAARLLRRSFRNWFRPSYPYVYAGFRVVEPA